MRRTGCVYRQLLVCLAAGLPAVLLCGAESRTRAQEASLAIEFYQDFRGQPLRPELKLYGPDIGRVARSEPEGLRFSLPAKRKDSAVVGVSPSFPISGDFEITVGYAVLGAEASPGGVGPNLRIIVGAPLREAAGLGHYLYPEQGDAYCVARTIAAGGGKPRDTNTTFPCKAKAGKLRLKRTGSALSFSVAEGPSDTFKELRHADFVDDDCTVRLAAKAFEGRALDVRFLDLRIRADSLPGVTSPSRPSEGWTIRVLPAVVAVAFIVAAVLGWVRRRRRIAKSQTSTLEMGK